MRHPFLPLVLAALLTSPASTPLAQPERAFTLAEAIALADSRNLSISAARREVEASMGARQQAGVRPNPTLGGSVEDLRQRNRISTLTVDLPLELGGKRAARITAADQATALADAEYGRTRSELRADVIQGFFRVMASQERLRLADDSAGLAAQAAEAIHRRVQAGKVSPVDETRARVDQANAELEVDEARTGLATDRQALAALWGEADLPAKRVDGDLGELPIRPPLDALRDGIDASPELLVGRREAERRRALVEVERSKAVPDLAVSVGARRDNALGLTQAVVALSIPLPVFDRNQGAILEARRRADQADDQLALARIQLVAGLRQASMQLDLARRSAETLRTAILPSAQQAYDAARIGFTAGKFGFLEVIDAQRSLLAARTRYVNALANSNQAAAAIDRLLGR